MSLALQVDPKSYDATKYPYLVSRRKEECVVCDLDGTLCHIDHRLNHVTKKPKDWDSFFAEIPGDTLNTQLARVLRVLRDSGIQVIFVSGRPERCRKDTVRWLNKHYGIYDHVIYMRKDDDRREDYVVKEEILKKYLEPLYDILCVFDDRPSVIDMWRRNGLLCLALPSH